MIYFQLFWEFVKVGIFCVGGGYASMPLIQAGIVETHHWLTMTEFVDVFTISQMTPGPIGINAATFAGMKVAGIGGAVAATAGFALPSFIIGVALAKMFMKYGNINSIRGVLNGLRPAVVALICSAGVSFVILALWNSDGIPADMSTVDWRGVILLPVGYIMVKKKLGVIKTLLGTGVLGLAITLLMR